MAVDGAGDVGFFTKVRNDGNYRMRLLHTAAVMWMFMSLGWLVSVIGATFPDIRLIVDKDLETASWLSTAGNFGYMAGAFVFGFLFDKTNRLLLLTAICVLSAIFTTVYPWCSNFTVMLIVQAVGNIMYGGCDVAGNSHIASIWGRHAAPFMQWIHFGFSFGGFPSPLTADPFLAEKYCVPVNDSSTASSELSMSSTTESFNASTVSTTTPVCIETYGTTRVQWAYLIAGCVWLSAAIPFFTMYLLSRRKETNIETAYEEKNADNTPAEKHLPDLSMALKFTFVTSLMTLISLYASAEGRFSGLLSTFVIDELGWSSADGNHVVSLFWGTFAAGRFVGIFITRFLRPSAMVAIYLMALTLSYIGFFFGAYYEIDDIVWVFSGLAGFSMSVIFPSIFAWTAESIIKVTGKISAIYLVSVSLWNMVLPLLYGHLMQTVTDMYFVYLLIGSCTINFGIYVFIHVMSNIYVRPKMTSTDDADVKAVEY